MNKFKNLLPALVVATSVFLGGCSQLGLAPTQPPAASQEIVVGDAYSTGVDAFPASDMSGYEGLKGYDREMCFVDLTVKDIARLIENKESFVFIAAFSGCPWCNLMIGGLNNAALEEGVKVGYLNTRLDPSWESNIDIDDYDIFVELFGEYLQDDAEGIPHLYTPHVFCIKNGEIVAERSGVLEGVTDASVELTQEQETALEESLRSNIEAIK